MADFMLDNVAGDITASVVNFVNAFNSIAFANNLKLDATIALVMNDIHSTHSGDKDA